MQQAVHVSCATANSIVTAIFFIKQYKPTLRYPVLFRLNERFLLGAKGGENNGDARNQRKAEKEL